MNKYAGRLMAVILLLLFTTSAAVALQCAGTGCQCSATFGIGFAQTAWEASLSNLDKQVLSGLMEKPDHYDPLLEILRERGDRHEKGFIQYLKDQGYSVVEIDGIDISEQAIAQCFGHWPMKWV